jgi:hypothetical protein
MTDMTNGKKRLRRLLIAHGALALAAALMIALQPWDPYGPSAFAQYQREEGADAGGPAAAAFDLAQLHPAVRAAAESARDAERRANDMAARARAEAQRAEDAARRGERGEAGFRAYEYMVDNEPVRYAGGWTSNTRNGYGVLTGRGTTFAGDRYVGAWSGGEYSGLGVYYFAQNPGNTSNALRYEGEYAGSDRNGVGVHYWRSGARYGGGWRSHNMSGPGVYRFPDGFRFEGEFGNDKYNGYGVLWDDQGRVSQAGIWTDNRLVTPLGAQGQ